MNSLFELALKLSFVLYLIIPSENKIANAKLLSHMLYYKKDFHFLRDKNIMENLMQRILKYTINQKDAGVTIERFLRENGYSHHIIVHLKKTADGIMLNNLRAYTNQNLQAGDSLIIHINEESSSKNIEAVNIPLDIVYEDADIMVLNKPADMPIHPSQGNHDNTLANGVAYYFANQDIPYTYRCINRLDRDTTGLLILAKHMLSAAILSQMMKDRKIKRTYLALVEGISKVQGTINAPIGRKDGSTIERLIDEQNGETAVTHYKLLESANIPSSNRHIAEVNIAPSNSDDLTPVSLVEVHLETGRTHQIRIHMKSIGLPLVGDGLYNPNSSLLERQALHSYKLKFSHPLTNEPLEFTCQLPVDMNSLISHK